MSTVGWITMMPMFGSQPAGFLTPIRILVVGVLGNLFVLRVCRNRGHGNCRGGKESQDRVSDHEGSG